jgi:hypothetical protein
MKNELSAQWDTFSNDVEAYLSQMIGFVEDTFIATVRIANDSG